MPKVSVNRVSIYYESHGDGFPLVLTYGLGGNTGMWQPQVAALSARYRLILWDSRGHGRSESPLERDQYSLETSADDLLGLLDKLEIDRAYVGGLSMGGGIATRFALAYPERVAALLIIDSASASGRPMSAEGRMMRMRTAELAISQGMDGAAEYSLVANPNIVGRAKRGLEAVNQVRRMYRALNPVGYAHSVQALINRSDVTERLEEICTPTLALAGEDDQSLPAVRRFHRRIPSSKLVVLPDAGHLSNWDQPEMFNQSVLEFLEQVDALREVQVAQL